MEGHKINITPKGSSFSFLLYKSEIITFDEIYEILKKSEFTADLEKLKPGFLKIEKHSNAIISHFALPKKNRIEILKNGIVSLIEIPILESAKLIFEPGYIYVSGKTNAGKVAIQTISPFLNISLTNVKLNQEIIRNLSDEAEVITSVQFKKIPHQEVEKITLAGEMESIFDFKGLPLVEAEIASFTGIYNTPIGMRTIKFSQTGKIQIQKSKKNPVTLELLDWIIKKIS